MPIFISLSTVFVLGCKNSKLKKLVNLQLWREKSLGIQKCVCGSRNLFAVSISGLYNIYKVVSWILKNLIHFFHIEVNLTKHKFVLHDGLTNLIIILGQD